MQQILAKEFNWCRALFQKCVFFGNPLMERFSYMFLYKRFNLTKRLIKTRWQIVQNHCKMKGRRWCIMIFILVHPNPGLHIVLILQDEISLTQPTTIRPTNHLISTTFQQPYWTSHIATTRFVDHLLEFQWQRIFVFWLHVYRFLLTSGFPLENFNI